MKNRKISFILASGAMLLSLSALAGCGGTTETNNYIIPDSELYGAGLKYKDEFKSVLVQAPTTLNYLSKTDGSDLGHVANFVDGLVTNDAYGRLVNNLALSIEKNDTFQTYTIKLKQNVPWVDSKGVQASGNVDGKRTNLTVIADDFITTAKHVLDFKNNSKNAFMIAMFIMGAAEYSAITYVDQIQGASRPKNDAERVEAMKVYMADAFNIHNRSIDPDSLADIRAFKNVGYRAIDKHTLRIELTESVPFFPTMLTYAPFLPTSQAFLTRVGIGDKGFGASKENILYNGPFLWDEQTDTKITFVRNETFHGARQFTEIKANRTSIITEDYTKAKPYEVNPVHIKTINYTIAAADQVNDPKFARDLYEKEEIDGFSINSKDADGWKKYVVGNGEGTLEYDPNDPSKPGPVDPKVNTRYYDNVDYTWHMTINLNRPSPTVASPEVQKSMLTANELNNSARALQIKEVRELFVKSFDFVKHNERFGTDLIEQTQHQMYTYVPKGFALDDKEKDYVEFYYDAYAAAKGITPDAARELLAPGQYDSQLKYDSTHDEIAPYREKALKAVELYNSLAAASSQPTISYPIKLEAISIATDNASEWMQEEALALSVNRRMNAILTGDPAVGENAKFIMINNQNIKTSKAHSDVVYAGYGHLVVWGWAPDYGDPLSYLNSYVTNGEMAFAVGTAEAVTGFKLNASSTAIERNDNLLGKYNDLVDQGKRITNDYTQRYQKFAAAEYELLNEVVCVLPMYNLGQGWNASLSKAFGYGGPTASYGIANNRLIGTWILDEVPSRETRYSTYDRYLANKTAATKKGLIAIYPDYVW